MQRTDARLIVINDRCKKGSMELVGCYPDGLNKWTCESCRHKGTESCVVTQNQKVKGFKLGEPEEVPAEVCVA